MWKEVRAEWTQWTEISWRMVKGEIFRVKGEGGWLMRCLWWGAWRMR